MKIEKTNNEILVRFPTERDRVNPYMPDDVDVGQVSNLVGLIFRDDWGLARVIDMSYKGKADQIGQIVVRCTTMSKEEFVEQCEEAGIRVLDWDKQRELKEKLDNKFEEDDIQL